MNAAAVQTAGVIRLADRQPFAQHLLQGMFDGSLDLAFLSTSSCPTNDLPQYFLEHLYFPKDLPSQKTLGPMGSFCDDGNPAAKPPRHPNLLSTTMSRHVPSARAHLGTTSPYQGDKSDAILVGAHFGGRCHITCTEVFTKSRKPLGFWALPDLQSSLKHTLY